VAAVPVALVDLIVRAAPVVDPIVPVVLAEIVRVVGETGPAEGPNPRSNRGA